METNTDITRLLKILYGIVSGNDNNTLMETLVEEVVQCKILVSLSIWGGSIRVTGGNV